MLKRAFVVFALMVTSIDSANAEDLSYLNRYISFEDSIVVMDSPVLYSINGGTGTPCEDGWSSKCDPSLAISLENFLPICSTPDGMDARLDCLESVEAEIDGQMTVGEIVPNQVSYWDRYGFDAKPEKGIAKSTPFQIYKFEGLKHAKGDLFQIKALKSNSIKSGVINSTRYTFLIAPTYQEKQTYDCSYLKTPDGLCWVTGSFQSNTRFKLNIRTAQNISGWFTGRVTDPSIKFSSAVDGRNAISLIGLSQSVPAISRNYFYTNEVQRAEWNEIALKNPSQSWDVTTNEGKRYSMGTPYSADAIFQFEELVSRIKSFNNADSLKNIWRIESTVYGLTNKRECLDSKITGFVSSNAMTYEKEIPSWDASANSLVYKIASPHTALGQEFVGRYDLLISEQVGKCLWSLTSLKPVAEISVTGASGEQKVVTASSKIADGFYKFTVAGFTFSTNKISVKMLPEGSSPLTDTSIAKEPSNIPKPVVNPSPISSAEANPVRIKKSTITCVKGKVQKKITGVTPKCPTGYKKK
jgi:hypothetical protein